MRLAVHAKSEGMPRVKRCIALHNRFGITLTAALHLDKEAFGEEPARVVAVVKTGPWSDG